MSVPNTSLFAEFSPVSKSDWLAKIEKDLKGRPLAELHWSLEDPLSIEPFLHADDFAESPSPILDQRSANTWSIGEDVIVSDIQAANKQVLAALMAGVNAPRFVFDDYITDNQLSKLLEGIELDYITSHFQEKTENRSPLSFLKSLKTVAGDKAMDIKGAIHYDPFADGRHDVKAATEAVSWAADNLPNFTVMTVNAERFYQNTEGVVSELANALSAGENYLKRLIDNGMSAEILQNRIAFRFQVGHSYFVQIAKLRAFKLLWANVLSAYDVAPTVPTIFAVTSPIQTTEDVHTHKIKATTEAMSAVIAGVETLTVSASEASDFGRRIARNVQHLLSMESYLDKVADPSAGSYYIEKMTEQLAEAAWSAFQKLN
ncbi:MAG: hypothetical protein JNL70_21960 [Saprospiraceae bacterium]|nr:hypothetical protein [Saprospiraceae bacterium]